MNVKAEITKFAATKSGRNDPTYYRRLEQRNDLLEKVANQSSSVRIVECPRDPRIELRLSSRSRPAQKWVGQVLARLLECKLFVWRRPEPGDLPDYESTSTLSPDNDLPLIVTKTRRERAAK